MQVHYNSVYLNRQPLADIKGSLMKQMNKKKWNRKYGLSLDENQGKDNRLDKHYKIENYKSIYQEI